MSSPQLEDGYVRIANELLDAILAFDFSKRELNVVFAVIRKTYGYGKKADDLSLSQLHEITGIDSAHLSRAVRDLAVKKVLLIQQGRFAQSIGINKKYVEWKVLPKQQQAIAETATCQKSKEGVAETANKPLPKQQVQKTTQKTTPKDIAPRARDEIWDAVISVCGYEGRTPTKSERGAWNKAVTELKEINVTPKQIHARAAEYRRNWPNVSLTPSALARRWNECAPNNPGSQPKTIHTMTEMQLVEECRKRGINDSGKTRQQLIAALEAA